ncbi:hypothetical protein C7441_1038 [Pseudaminobacter salicylatoxidans]|uniref:Uncharacterized protein n=1 Tax=Pseudaminobacter salicylatoxidans TaxID=93369 RepID=A0A316CAS1_PSESE|nr:hypothetical protein [Pseudaminobacter salicylatoxidans]PWJ85157.1 hypothetical protein C7441_1038 [Pseudaminobacter salicylatoxidans]
MADPETTDENTPRRRITILGREIPLPESRGKRIALGIGLTFLGFLGFLPILGFWMIPVGLLVLSYEFALVRRYRRKGAVKLGRWWQRNGKRD